MMLLDSVSSPKDVKTMDMPSLDNLCAEIRAFLVENVTKTGGHLSSNLGVVELTVALHRVFDCPKDKLIWDVGHQSYVHKLLTGRRDGFASLRQFGGLSGFPKTAESQYDAADTGHSSTAISAALGYAAARDLKGESWESIAVVGDAAFSGGLSMEALNHIAHCHSKVIIVLNDNQMSIGEAVGGLAQYLNRIRTRASYYTLKRDTSEMLSKIPLIGRPSVSAIKRLKRLIRLAALPGVVFERLGCKYLGPVDGHNVRQLCDVFEEAKRLSEPVLVHVFTKKGKGYAPAEADPSAYHAISPASSSGESFSMRFGSAVTRLAEKNPSLVVISPSTPVSCGLRTYMQKFPARFFDTGIAEAHAVTFAAGLSLSGFVPIVSVYSSFLQRGYDSLVHDIALTKRHVVFAIDRAGLVGEDGETHQGILDLSYLSHLPGMAILAPATLDALDPMLSYAVEEHDGPIAIRYPRGTVPALNAPPFTFGQASVLRVGNHITLAAVGRMVHTALSAAALLEKRGILAEVLDLRTIKPLDMTTIFASCEKTGAILTIEDNTLPGGVGMAISAEATRRGYKGVLSIAAFPDVFVQQGTVEQLMQLYGLDASGIAAEAERIAKI
ncbi:MAG: 1-deoxy-D-xylulose-5-phosphate synthase [Clostridia bacterium]|nr:1-deoxy-D-xylulose-5-phosphate synthase [Clostridia bacterium]